MVELQRKDKKAGAASMTKRSSLCAYCGKEARTTGDHVPPRSLLPPGQVPRGVELIKVPACSTCHLSFGKDDEYFGTVLAMRKDISEHPEGQKLLPKLFRGISRARARPLNMAIFKTMARVELTTPQGLWAGTAPTFKPDWARLDRTADRMVRGLYFHEFGSPIPASHRVMARIDVGLVASQDVIDRVFSKATVRTVWPGVFAYAFAATDDRVGTAWTLVFYGSAAFVGITLDDDDPRYLAARAEG